jgi:hypothetical protein
MVALTEVVLLVFSLVLIAIGLAATARLRRSGRARPAPSRAPAAQPEWRARSAQVPDYAPAPMPKGAAPAQDAPGGAGYAADEWAGQPVTAYPGGMDAEAAEIERLRAEIAALKAHNGDGAGLKRTQTLVAVAANVSGILGLLVSVAALIK